MTDQLGALTVYIYRILLLGNSGTDVFNSRWVLYV